MIASNHCDNLIIIIMLLLCSGGGRSQFEVESHCDIISTDTASVMLECYMRWVVFTAEVNRP